MKYLLFIIMMLLVSCGSEKEKPQKKDIDTTSRKDTVIKRETAEPKEPQVETITADVNHIIGAENEELYSSCSYPGSKLEASSTKKGGRKLNYSIENIGDNNINTAWVEGSKDYGIGEYFEFEYVFNDTLRPCENYCQYFTILNGYQRSRSYFREYSRVKSFKVFVNGTLRYYLDLKDEPGMQFFYMDFLKGLGRSGVARLKFQIADVYPGSMKSKKETAITELFFSCEP